MQRSELLHPADEVRVRTPQVARHRRALPSALNACPQTLPEDRDAPLNLIARPRRLPGKPLAEIRLLNRPDLVQPRRVPSGHGTGIRQAHDGNGVRPRAPMNEAVAVVVPFFAAIATRQIVGREAHQQYARLTQTSENA